MFSFLSISSMERERKENIQKKLLVSVLNMCLKPEDIVVVEPELGI
jgi:hypothetical protein